MEAGTRVRLFNHLISSRPITDAYFTRHSAPADAIQCSDCPISQPGCSRRRRCSSQWRIVPRSDYIAPIYQATRARFHVLTHTRTDPPKSVVVKFIDRYRVEARHVPAKENLTLQLIFHGKLVVQDVCPSYGDLRMVVMGYIDGMTFDVRLLYSHYPPFSGSRCDPASFPCRKKFFGAYSLCRSPASR